METLSMKTAHKHGSHSHEHIWAVENTEQEGHWAANWDSSWAHPSVSL